MIYLESDSHYFHKRVIEYCKRPYSSVEDMNEKLIKNHNRTVPSSGTTYHMGDFIFSRKKEEIKQVISSLNGNHYFLRGNHDDWHRSIIQELVSEMAGKIIGFGPYLEINHNKIKVVLCHYPFVVFNKSHHGSINFYGHCHSNMEEKYNRGKQMDVGVDNIFKLKGEYRPISIDEGFELVKDRGPKDHHPKEEDL